MRGKRMLLSAGALAVLGISAAPAGAASLKVDNDKVQCKTAAYTKIQDAVDAAAAGDTVQVCAGTYQEQVEVTKSIKLVAVTRRAAVIKAPAQLTGNETVVNFKGAGIVASMAKFVVDAKSLPANGASCDGDIWGVRVVEGAKATLTDNEIANATPSDPSLMGCQYGIAVGVGGFYGYDGGGNVVRTTGNANLTNNDIHGYAKLGVYIDNAGTVATVKGNRISGDGRIGEVAQNGIQLSRGAKATIQSNTIADHSYSGPDYYGAGILLYRAAQKSIVGTPSPGGNAALGNTLTNNDYGLDIEDSQKSSFGRNVITGSSDEDGVGIFVGQFEGVAAEGHKFHDNVSTGNDTLDCQDDTSGTGTAGTGNAWVNNSGNTSDPAGICNPASVAVAAAGAGGWDDVSTNGGVASFSGGTLDLATDGDGGFAQLKKNYGGDPALWPTLASLSTLAYDFATLQRQAGSKVAPTLKLEIFGATPAPGAPSNPNGFSTLNFEPTYTSDAIENGSMDTVLPASKWWSTRSILGAPSQSTYVSLAEIVAANPGAKIYSVSVAAGQSTSGGWDLFHGTVDTLELGFGDDLLTRYDFG